MKLQNTPNLQQAQVAQKNQQMKNNPSFKGGEALTSALNFIQMNQAVGATLVDVSCMCAPRTIVDFSRSTDAGIETARREFSSSVNDGMLGVYGMGAAYLLAKSFNNKYDVRVDKMFIDEDSLNMFADMQKKSGNINKPENMKKYLSQIIENTSGFNPNKEGSEATKGWVKLNSGKEDFVQYLSDALSKDVPKNEAKNHVKETTKYLKALLLNSMGAEENVKLELNGKSSIVNVDDYVDNVYKISKSFMSEKVLDNAGLVKDDFLKGLKNIHSKTAVAGLAICMLISTAVQPINMYLTKKKTGKSGFVGVEGREPDNSNGFKLMKIGTAAAALTGALYSITNGKKITTSAILEKVKFKGFVPTLNQFKLIYGATIVSRLLSSRDKNELRESAIKDSLGFANWLILGAFASKLTAIGLEKLDKFKKDGIKFVNYNKANSTNDKGKIKPKWLDSSVATRSEAIAESMSKFNISPFKEINGKKIAKTFSECFAEAAKADPKLKIRNRYLGLIQFVGYLWSGLALGIGVPKLNIAITNAVENKNQKA